MSNEKCYESLKEVFGITFNFYTTAEKHRNLYKDPKNIEHTKNLINLYFSLINPKYDDMMSEFKRKYVNAEANVEKNDTKEEKMGLELVYDHITDYDKEATNFNIMQHSFKIHQLLYKILDDRVSDEYIERREKIKKLIAEKNASSDKRGAYEAKKELAKLGDSPRFGGKLRDGNVIMNNIDFEVMSYIDSMKFINTFAGEDARKEFYDKLNNASILEYIDYCVKTTADLIAAQPFRDGNKRTFRSLLNLMFKMRNIPPVFIKSNEREIYKDALIKAMKDKDYTELSQFYYFKICDSIYELDFQNKNKEEKQETR